MLPRRDGSSTTGVSVVLTAMPDHDAFWGSTVGTMMSASLDPPMILVLLRSQGRASALVRRSRRFTVSVLNEAQVEVSESLAGPRAPLPRDDRRLTCAPDGAFITGASAHLACHLNTVTRVGDHDLLTAVVMRASGGSGHGALVRHYSHYARAVPHLAASTSRPAPPRADHRARGRGSAGPSVPTTRRKASVPAFT